MPNLWSANRRGRATSASPDAEDHRTPFEHDHDRLLFSTPVRRMADKTQVFPLERNDAVRTRLTHSHEVSNLARSIGNRLVRRNPGILGGQEEAQNAPVILAAAGLAHDLGNPPFGHQGEEAIRRWFENNRETHAYQHPDVLRKELQGAVAVSKLMHWFWEAITSRKDSTNPSSGRSSAFATYAYSLISDNYRSEFEKGAEKKDKPLRYYELRLLTDMISGMTDSFTMNLFHDLEPLHNA